MAGENTTSTLAALFQEVYADSLLKFVPQGALLVKDVKFSGAETTTGGKFIQPVVLGRENGFTYAAPGSDAFDLGGSLPAVVKRAEILGSQLVGQGRLGYEAAARASKGKAAFAQATELLVENMVESATYRLELMFLYGQTGIGTVDANTTTDAAFVVSAESWAPAIWAGLEGASITIMSADNGTKRDTVTIVSIEMDEDDAAYRTVTTDEATLSCTAGDLVFFETAADEDVFNECLGLDAILTQSSSTLWEINVASYPLFRGNVYDVNGALTVTHIMNAAKRARNKGCKLPLRLYVSPKGWLSLINPTIDPVASNSPRKIDSSYSAKKVEFGTEAIVIHGPQGQTIDVVPHMYVKEGEAFLVPMKRLKRVGACDIDFKTPGMAKEEMFIHLQDKAAYELRCYANQALFVEKPSDCVKLFGIS